MYDKYDLARRFHDLPKQSIRVVEIGTVLKTEPLTIQIGDGIYIAGKSGWKFYEPIFEDKEAEIKEIEHKNGNHNGASVDCSVGSISSMSYSDEKIEKGTYKERKAYMKYNVGDVLAIQQMSGENEFIILCKLREVV